MSTFSEEDWTIARTIAVVEQLQREVKAGRELEVAAQLKRVVLIHEDVSGRNFEGKWVAIPRADLDNLRTALARYTAAREAKP